MKTLVPARFGNKRKILIQCGQPFICPCGNQIKTNDLYLAAHWTVPLDSKCEVCGQRFGLLNGEVRLT